MNKLTPKQKAFADNYLINGFNATRAYKDAGYTVKNNAVAEASGSKLLGNSKVSDYISKRLNKIEKKKETKQVNFNEMVDNMLLQYADINQVGFTIEKEERLVQDEETGLPVKYIREKRPPRLNEVIKLMEMKLRLEELALGRQTEDDKLDMFIDSLEEQANE